MKHPEIELRPTAFSDRRPFTSPTATILDLLEVYPDHVNWKERLDHSSLLSHFRVGGFSSIQTVTQFLEAEDGLNPESPQPSRILCVHFEFALNGSFVEHTA
jgi:hypothetical protein